MNKDRKQQRLLSLILFLIVLSASWFLFLQPALQENRNLKADLSSRESVTDVAGNWQDSAKQEARALGVEIVSAKDQEWVLRGPTFQVLSLLSSIEEESNLTLGLTKRKRNFVLSW